MRFPPQFACLLIFTFLPAILLAQSTVYTASDGVVLLSNKPGCYYTLDIPGRSVRPAGMDSSPNPIFSADGKFLQVITVPGDEFHGNPKMSDEDFLRSHLSYEAGHHKLASADIKVEVTSIAKGQTALFWSFVPPIPQAKEQVFLTFRSRDHVLILGSAIDPPQTRKEIRAFLIKTASSFHRSTTPMTLQFSNDGSYTRKSK